MPEKIELLAPAGRWDVLERVTEAGADAVYIGGKRFNMRLLKGDYNFTDDEIEKAVQFLHAKNKKLYITINNLYFENELEEIIDYLLFLEDVGVDAIIVQDLSIVNIHKSLNLTIPLHASVQIGLGNSNAVNFFEELGFSRVILSKNLSLTEIKEIKSNTNIGIEYFAHGDLCISHAGQCHMSSFIAGASGNRGKCIKPCRWPYTLGGQEGYYLAHSDLSLFPYISDLMKAGVNSLKIEGRMRDADYLAGIINIYRTGIDEITDTGYLINENLLNDLNKFKVRNLTVANLWGELDREAVDITGENEPFFPTKPRKLERLEPKEFENERIVNDKYSELAVKIGNKSAFNMVKDYCDTVILGLDKFGDDSSFNLQEIKDFLDEVATDNINIKIETPRIVTEKNWANILSLSELSSFSNLTGFIINDYGSLNYLVKEGFKVWGGPSLNIYNSKTYDLLVDYGVEGLCLSPELKLENLKVLKTSQKNFEIIVHGPLCGIITDYPIEQYYANNTEEYNYLLDNFAQKYRLRLDTDGRTHIYYPYDLSLFDYLNDFLNLGINRMRIEGHFYNNDELAKLVYIYRKGLGLEEKEKKVEYRNELLNLFPGGLADLSFTRPNI